MKFAEICNRKWTALFDRRCVICSNGVMADDVNKDLLESGVAFTLVFGVKTIITPNTNAKTTLSLNYRSTRQCATSAGIGAILFEVQFRWDKLADEIFLR